MSEREKYMKKLYEYGFALTEVNLFLDSHPTCERALEYYREYRDLYEQTVAEYEHRFGPLTASGVTDESFFTWVLTPWPWELEG